MLGPTISVCNNGRQIGPTRHGEVRQRIDVAIISLRNSVMSVQGEEFPQLAIYNPPHGTLGVLAFNPEYSLVTVQRMETVRDTNLQAMEERGHLAMALFVTLNPEAEHEGRKTPSDQLVRDVHVGWRDASRRRVLCLRLTGDVRKQ